MRSITRQEKPHSLSYQERTFTASPSTTVVNGASTMEEWGLPRKSHETSSSCETARIPLRLPLAAFSNARFTSAAVTLFSSHAVESSHELGEHLGDGNRGSGSGRDHRESRCPRAPQVLVRQIQELLVVGVGVHRGHDALLQPELLVQDLDDRSEAVRGAGSVREDVVLRRVVLVVVDTHDEGDVLARGGSGDDDFLGAGGEVLRGVVSLGEQARGLDDDIDPEGLPRKIRRVLLFQDLEALLAGDDGVSLGAYVLLEVPQDRVVLEKMRRRLGVGHIVRGDDIDLRVMNRRAKHVSSNASESVDPNLDSHRGLPFEESGNTRARAGDRV